MWKYLLSLSFLSLTACGGFNLAAPVAPPDMRCNLPKTELGLRPDQTPTDLQYSSYEKFYDDVVRALDQNGKPVLYLSGGSQNGAFGAGFLDTWSDEGGGLPDFAVVTGVSTGAILSLAAFANETQTVVDGYTIDGEGDLLNPRVTPKNGKLGLFDYVTALQKGAVGDLTPLEGRITEILNGNDIINKIARRGEAGGRLYIAATDVDYGYAVAFDMTEMAQTIVAAPTDRKPFLTNCFVKAVLASSSVPLAAPPVFIDNRMYIDGGVRFSVISDEIERAMQTEKRGYVTTTSAPTRAVFLLINGDQATKPACNKKDPSLCTPDLPSGGQEGELKDWSLINLAFRSVKILTDQVAEFSEYKIRTEVNAKGDDFEFAFIEPEGRKFQHTQGSETRSCEAWEKIDDELESPLEFHRRYMRCIMAYGRAEAKAKTWWLKDGT